MALNILLLRLYNPQGRYTLGDKLQQHAAATYHSMCTGRATSCSSKVRRHVAATNCFMCTGEFLWISLSPQQNFVAATSRKKSNQTESVRLVAATKFCCSGKDFHKFLQYTLSDLSLQRVAATCCCNLSPRVYRPSEKSSDEKTQNSTTFSTSRILLLAINIYYHCFLVFQKKNC